MDFTISKRETSILKGIAILSVIWAHSNGAGFFENIRIIGNSILAGNFCSAGICLFLFLSGYGIYCSLERSGIKNYWQKKLFKILIPYMCVQIFWIMYMWFKEGVHYSLFTTLTQLLGINPSNSYDASMWYVSYQFFWYIYFFVIFIIFRKLDNVVLVMCILNIICYELLPKIWDVSFYCTIPFTLGAIFARHRKNFVEKKTSIVMFIILCSVAYELIYLHGWRIKLADNIGSCSLMFSIIILIKWIEKIYSFPILNFIGKISFWLYLLQIIIFSNSIYKIYGLRLDLYVVTLIVTIFLASILYKIYNVIQKYLFKI